MLRALIFLTAVAALVLAGPASAGSPPFKTGSFSGKASGKAVSIKLYAGTCKKQTNNANRLKGFCFKVLRFPVLKSECPGGTIKKSDPFVYNIVLPRNGKFADVKEMVSSAVREQTYEVRTLKFKAVGSKITGSATWQATSTDGSPRNAPGLDCSKASISFTLKRAS